MIRTRRTVRGPAAAVADKPLIGVDVSRAQALYKYRQPRRFDAGALGLPIFLLITALTWAFGQPASAEIAAVAFSLMLSTPTFIEPLLAF